MRKKTLLWVILLMSISLIGLIGFQVYWIQHAVQMEEEVFDRNVNDALHQVARRLETQEAMHFLKEEAPQIRKAALSSNGPTTVQLKTSAPSKGKEPATQVDKNVSVYKNSSRTPTVKVSLSSAPASALVAYPSTKGFIAFSEGYTNLPEGITTHQLLASSTHSEALTGNYIELFGKGITDSVVIWKLLASQAFEFDNLTQLLIDSLQNSLPTRSQHKEKAVTAMALRPELDSLSILAKHEAINVVKPRDIQKITVRGNMLDISIDSLFNKKLRNSLVFKGDTFRGKQTLRFIPAVREHSKGAPAVAKTQAKSASFTVSRLPAAVKNSAALLLGSDCNKQEKAQAKVQHLSKVMQQMAVEYVRKEKPLDERLKQLNLESLLANELLTRSINTPYQCSLQSAIQSKNLNIVLASTKSTVLPEHLRENEYAVRLFPNDVMTAPSYLILKFPDRNMFVWQSLLIPSAISVLFTLIIILTFSFTLYTILRQKKISEIKNDFINNMTHEFKTPIATISLALDSLVNPKVRSDESRIDFYARIIRDENKRMHQQVEKVLQTAQMDRKTLQLAFEEVDVHQLIRKAAEPFQLHIEQRQGTLDLLLEADQPIVWADPSHLSNMIANLLDNANKYSPNSPKIIIQTATIAKGLHISVEDQGAGMSREAQKRVFDKFYRVPTGNVHNVKGFGLGLCYVKSMAEAHSGSIHLRSELGKGSKFTLWLPFQKHST